MIQFPQNPICPKTKQKYHFIEDKCIKVLKFYQTYLSGRFTTTRNIDINILLTSTQKKLMTLKQTVIQPHCFAKTVNKQGTAS